MIALCFDVETTGLCSPRVVPLDRQPEVIEINMALVDLSSGQVKSEFDSLIKPTRPLSEKPAPGSSRTIQQITGISNEMLADAKPFKELSKKIFTMIETAPIVIAHNAAFDCECLDIEAERLKYKIRWPKKCCTIESTMAMRGYRLSLTNLHTELFKESFSGAHRAKSDVSALVRCAVELFKRGMI